jgi:hypothetical protein
MGFFELVFGRQAGRSMASQARLPIIKTPPAGVALRKIRPRKGPTVQASLAKRSGVLSTSRGPMRYKAGRHYIVEHGPDDRSVVRRDVFERTYSRRADGRFEKRTDVSYRCFTLPYPVMVRTLEGLEFAKTGDWIVEGVNGELWPVWPEKAEEIYERAS